MHEDLLVDWDTVPMASMSHFGFHPDFHSCCFYVYTGPTVVLQAPTGFGIWINPATVKNWQMKLVGVWDNGNVTYKDNGLLVTKDLKWFYSTVLDDESWSVYAGSFDETADDDAYYDYMVSQPITTTTYPAIKTKPCKRKISN